MSKAIKAVQTYAKASPRNAMDTVAHDVLVRTEGEPDITIQIMAHSPQDALDRINGMPEPMLREMVELERVVGERVRQLAHHGD
jgi:hypothetical protein